MKHWRASMSYNCRSPANSHGIITPATRAQSRGWSVVAKRKATMLSVAVTDVQTFWENKASRIVRVSRLGVEVFISK